MNSRITLSTATADARIDAAAGIIRGVAVIIAEIEGMSAAATAAALEKIEDVNPGLAARLDRRPVLTE